MRKTLYLPLLIAIPLVAYAATEFDNVDVGNAAVNTATASALAVGYGNTANQNSIAGGEINTSKYASAAFGVMNDATYRSFASGWGNFASGYAAAFGQDNKVNEGIVNLSPERRFSFATGQMNVITGGHNFAAGAFNHIVAFRAAAIGTGLINTVDDSTIVGSYNEEKSGIRFVVGRGTESDEASRSNALEVYADGDVIIPKRQGDVLMGSFGNGN